MLIIMLLKLEIAFDRRMTVNKCDNMYVCMYEIKVQSFRLYKMPNSVHTVLPIITSIDLYDKELERLAFLDQRSVAKQMVLMDHRVFVCGSGDGLGCLKSDKPNTTYTT